MPSSRSQLNTKDGWRGDAYGHVSRVKPSKRVTELLFFFLIQSLCALCIILYLLPSLVADMVLWLGYVRPSSDSGYDCIKHCKSGTAHVLMHIGLVVPRKPLQPIPRRPTWGDKTKGNHRVASQTTTATQKLSESVVRRSSGRPGSSFQNCDVDSVMDTVGLSERASRLWRPETH